MSIYKNGQKVLGSFNDVTGFVEKSDITTTINSSSTDNQVPSAKSVYDKVKSMVINQITITTSSDTIENYLETLTPNIDVLFVSNSTTGELVELTGEHLFLIEYRKVENLLLQRAYQAIDGKLIACRSKNWWDYTWSTWQKVCTTSVADVPLTKIIFRDTTNYEAYNQGTNTYEVVNGICYLQADITVKNKVMVFNEVLNGLPMSKTLQHGLVGPWNSEKTNANLLFEIRNGALLLAYGEPSQHHLINIAYPVKES